MAHYYNGMEWNIAFSDHVSEYVMTKKISIGLRGKNVGDKIIHIYITPILLKVTNNSKMLIVSMS